MSNKNEKIVDLLKGRSTSSFSFEITPDMDINKLDTLDCQPLFYSVTWHAKKYSFHNLDIAPLRTAADLRSKNKQVLLHLSCDLLTREYLDDLLDFLKLKGICNLFVVLGEQYDGINSYFKATKDLITYIRQKTGTYFCIGVAGFPDNVNKIPALLDKTSAGADFILTQAFFDLQVYVSFVEECRKVGVVVPIIPGVFIFENKRQLDQFCKLCQVKVSPSMLDRCSEIGSEGKKVCMNFLNSLIVSSQSVVHIHIFTLNKVNETCSFMKDLKIKNN